MIECFSAASGHKFPGLLYDVLEFRHRVFIREQGYADVFDWEGMEFDACDTPATHYFVYREKQGNILGTLRVSPTLVSYMIKDVWPGFYEALPESEQTWEQSRLAVKADGVRRKMIVAELLLASMEFGMARSISNYVGVMPPKLWHAIYKARGWKPTFHSQPIMHKEYPLPIVAGELNVSSEQEREIRNATNIHHTVLSFDIANHRN